MFYIFIYSHLLFLLSFHVCFSLPCLVLVITKFATNFCYHIINFFRGATPHSVGFLWPSDQPDTEIST